MARMARVVVPGVPHHVTQRGARRQRVFFRQSDWVAYLDLLAKRSEASNTRILAYCLMPNHVHHALVPHDPSGLRRTMAETHRRYAVMINRRKGWQGHLWQERFYSVPMDEAHLIATVRYIEYNPVRAGLCARPEHWPWSSARAHLSARSDGVVCVESMLALVGDWARFLAAPPEPDFVARLRRHSRTGRPLGQPEFVRYLERITGRRMFRRSRGRGSTLKETAEGPGVPGAGTAAVCSRSSKLSPRVR